MEEILDRPREIIQEDYLKKSTQLYKAYGWCFATSIMMSMVLREDALLRGGKYSLLYELVYTLPIIFMMILAPLGLSYVWRSFKLRQGALTKRIFHLIGYSLFSLMLVGIVVQFVRDIDNLYDR